MGRKKIEVDVNIVRGLAGIGCTYEEIAAATGVSKSTLIRRFDTVIKEGAEKFKMSLRRLQYEAAKKGNVTMLIWLGKQYLGQSDKIDSNAKVDSGDNLTATFRAMVSATAGGNVPSGAGALASE